MRDNCPPTFAKKWGKFRQSKNKNEYRKQEIRQINAVNPFNQTTPIRHVTDSEYYYVMPWLHVK